jgi:hypothetical protein
MDVQPDHALPAARVISPNLPRHVRQKLAAFIWVTQTEERGPLAAALRRVHEAWKGEAWTLQLRAVALLLADLIEQGWRVSVRDVTSDGSEEEIVLQPPGLQQRGETVEEAKGRLRQGLTIGRDRQLSEPSVQKFAGRMHRAVRRLGRKTSIANIIDNGAELERQLQVIRRLPTEEALVRLKEVIDPVVEPCDSDTKCSATGLNLIDIWRYFRHSWSLEYRSAPGRQLAFLIRNASRPDRPVMGIAMLASPVVRMRVRDSWVGWTSEQLISDVERGTVDAEFALRAMVTRLDRSLAEVRTDDLLSPEELTFPTDRTILRMEQRWAGAALARRHSLTGMYEEAIEADEAVRSDRDVHKCPPEQIDWLAASNDHLFVKKRAEAVWRLLRAKRVFQDLDWGRRGNDILHQLLRHRDGQRALDIAMQEVRKAGIASQVADVSVCGAVAPYNHLLAGKLVALLMASNEVLDAYRMRYSTHVSLISSQMAGRAIYRPANLKVITTTSLYGRGSSQYNRLRLRASEYPVLNADIAWEEIATTAGYGTVHLSQTTTRVLRDFTDQVRSARHVNHRFGEGASPRLRQIRQALDDLGIASSDILHHATPRIFYGCEIHEGAKAELLGVRPNTESKGCPAAMIADAWRRRWLRQRLDHDDVLARVAADGAHTLENLFQSFAQDDEKGHVQLPLSMADCSE